MIGPVRTWKTLSIHTTVLVLLRAQLGTCLLVGFFRPYGPECPPLQLACSHSCQCSSCSCLDPAWVVVSNTPI
ncbi:hypothetical protein BV25DRAFT_1292260 [Artomyces pyxidatus]|uniref:Uncharacterized protein n=1 Tax=Artomyces pyxidatus TaxID=48021 RepID=A0ACB8SPY1_9AGAM|nr:hypothetical protein BV25DRAFT_1292260 [Artomyces pyxidatus]